MTLPVVGRMAPAFALENDAGERVALKDLRGQHVVLFFYPKDDTPTCTAEACDFRDLLPRFAGLDAVVLGISPDSVKSHAKFKAKYGLPYALLADVDHAVSEKYGVWKEKVLYGRRYMGVVRTTFVIGPTGKVRHVFENVKTDGHGDAVAAVVESYVRRSSSS
ncbi:MAG: thioredoxin-dependent thiol peroxidase [Gemmatimonadaceae bacterium]|nr:thioredoxin-dependent thiol peroxidase [Gemmatimonadaceae bacterium]